MKVVDMTQILSKEDKASHKPPKVGHKGKRKEDIYTNFCEKKRLSFSTLTRSWTQRKRKEEIDGYKKFKVLR